MREKDKEELAKLIVQLASGNTEALNGISTLMAKPLYSLGNYYYRNKADIEDRVSELYITLTYKAHTFKQQINAYAWVIKIYENSIKSNLRIIKREEEYLRREISYFKSSLDGADDTYLENHLFLREMFDKLTEEERQIIIYYYWCERTIREVAEIIGVPKSTMAYKLSAIKEKIVNS